MRALAEILTVGFLFVALSMAILAYGTNIPDEVPPPPPNYTPGKIYNP